MYVEQSQWPSNCLTPLMELLYCLSMNRVVQHSTCTLKHKQAACCAMWIRPSAAGLVRNTSNYLTPFIDLCTACTSAVHTPSSTEVSRCITLCGSGHQSYQLLSPGKACLQCAGPATSNKNAGRLTAIKVFGPAY